MTSTSSASHDVHAGHDHRHGPGCGHTAIRHGDHVDYLHDGHLHHPHDDHVDEHVLEVDAARPDRCTPGHACAGHDAAHAHGPGCGHEPVPHGDHFESPISLLTATAPVWLKTRLRLILM